MRAILTTLAVMLVLWAAPAAAGERLIHETPFSAKPRPVASFVLAERRIDMLAVTRLARADTARRRAHLYESEAMAKVMPGYPQPAFVSLDLRLNF
jgi:hypothetical protein